MTLLRFRFVAAAGLTILLLPAMAARQMSSTPQKTRAARISAREVLARAEPVCRALFPASSGLRLAADSAPHGPEGQFLNLVCEENDGAEMANLKWNLVTGEVYMVSLPPRPPAPDRMRPMNDRQAAAVTFEWVRALGIAEKSARWSAYRAPKHINRVWSYWWRGAKRNVFVMVDDRTGELIQARLWRPEHMA